jgi:hypothetical protein
MKLLTYVKEAVAVLDMWPQGNSSVAACDALVILRKGLREEFTCHYAGCAELTENGLCPEHYAAAHEYWEER